MRCPECGGRVIPTEVPPEGWQLRSNTSAHAAIRPVTAPAPTMLFGARLNTMKWERRNPTQT